MKLKRFLLSGAIALSLSGVSTMAIATAIYEAGVYYYGTVQSNGIDRPADSYKYQVTSSDPGNGDSCMNSGSQVEYGSNGASKEITVVSIGPPFSGSTSRTRYLTMCYQHRDAYVTEQMYIKLSGCFSWVCTTTWGHATWRNDGVYNYEVDSYATAPHKLDISVTNPTDY
ncbi:MAG: hypothetical protein GY727_04825 [Gammaproteobacteria bacterium]|nr:hypothetical protein [Gammaproteobacteria bacterium]